MAALSLQPVDVVINALRSAGCNPKSAGPTQWNAKCPVQAAHKGGDKNPSLSVGESPTGKALITCHRGCTLPDICSTLNLSMRDLFPDDTPGSTKATGKDHEEATYAYYDEDGELLYEVVKWRQADGGKTFRARAPQPDGSWKPNASGVRRVLYHLPQVRKAVAEGRVVVICEGEKDAENAQWWWPKAATTTNPFGAGVGKWTAEYNEHLEGADVIIVADDDTTGVSHAWEIEINLRGIAKRVRMFMPAKGFNDLSEMMGAGKTIEDLRPFGPGATVEQELDVMTELAGRPDEFEWLNQVDWDALRARDTETAEWLAEPIIASGRGHAIFAKGGTGKSLLAFWLALTIATGGIGPDGARVERARVLYLDYEMTEDDLIERVEAMGFAEADLTWLTYGLLPSNAPADTWAGGQQIAAAAERDDVALVIIDTFSRAVEGDENDSKTTIDFYANTGRALKRAGRAMLRMDHSGKDESKGQRGSSAKNDDVDIVWHMSATDDGVKLLNKKKRTGWVPDSIILRLVEEPLRYEAARQAIPAGTARVIDDLDSLGIGTDVTKRAAAKLLRDAGRKASDATLLAAQRTRRERDTASLMPTTKRIATARPPAAAFLGEDPDF